MSPPAEIPGSPPTPPSDRLAPRQPTGRADPAPADLLALTRELQDLRMAVEQAATAIVITDPDGRIEYVNPVFERQSGYTVAEVLGKNPRILNSGRQPPAFFQHLWSQITTGETWHGILQNKHKDGSFFWESATISPVLGPDGRVQRFIAVKEDITARVVAEQALARQHEKLAQVLDAASAVSIIATDPQGTITLFNRGACNMLGYREEEVVGIATPEMIHVASELSARAVELSAEVGRPVSGFETFTLNAKRFGSETRDWTYLAKDGRAIQVSLVVTAMRNEFGETTGFLGIAQDISETRRIQAALRDSENLLEQAGEVAGVGGWELDLATMVPRWTRQTRILHEVALDYEPPLLEALSFYAPEARPLIEQAVQDAIVRGTPWDLEVPFITAKGRRIWVRVLGRPEIQKGKTTRLVGTFQDITERKLREDELRHTNLKLQAETARAEAASRAKGEFLANMSHEIRTPLNAIIGLSEMLENDPTGPEAREFLHTIRQSGDSLLELINDILDFSKIEAGQLSLERVPMDLRHCADNALRTVAVQAAKRGLHLRFDFDPDLPTAIVGDASRLRQILVNLLTNAVKFTELGEVALSIGRGPDESLEFAVTDTGIGMSAADQKLLFRSFSQVGVSTLQRFGGTGLGLAISQKLVHLMNGEIRVESTPGVGSKFHFAIPLILTESSAPARRPKISPIAVGSQLAARLPLKILVVEDNLVNQLLIVAMLKRIGYEPALATNGREALACIENAPVDLVFMDVQMPVLDGLATTRILCEIYPAHQRPRIVALTANAMGGDQALCLAAGMDDYLSKPIRHEQLVAAIERGAARRPPAVG